MSQIFRAFRRVPECWRLGQNVFLWPETKLNILGKSHRERAVKDYLVTLKTMGPTRIHAYVSADSEQRTSKAVDHMVAYAKAADIEILPDPVLLTELAEPTDAKLVSGIMHENDDPGSDISIAADDGYFHRIFKLPKNHPSDRSLMELHHR